MNSEPAHLPEVERAWRYYQHADSIQHQRHGFLLVAQAMLFAAYAQRPEAWSAIYALIGAVFAGVWYVQAERLSDGMTALSRQYLEAIAPLGGDAVYQTYLDGLARNERPSGRCMLNIFIPGLTAFIWVVLGLRAAFY